MQADDQPRLSTDQQAIMPIDWHHTLTGVIISVLISFGIAQNPAEQWTVCVEGADMPIAPTLIIIEMQCGTISMCIILESLPGCYVILLNYYFRRQLHVNLFSMCVLPLIYIIIYKLINIGDCLHHCPKPVALCNMFLRIWIDTPCFSGILHHRFCDNY